MPEKDFVTFLLDETMKLQASGADLTNLEIKMNDYGISFLKGEFIPQIQLLRFKTPFGVLDVPINWSLFSIEGDTTSTSVEEKNDDDHFFAVLKSAWNLPLEKVVITHDEGFCYIVGLKAGEDVHLHDLLRPQEWLKSA